jgi:N utilization substance protein A
MVGQKGTRVMAVINELGGEKIDIIEYSPEPDKYVANALSPAKVLEVKVLPRNRAQVSVPEDQLSLAIGKNGQNVRLAAKLTGWKIDVKSPSGEVVSSEELLKDEEPEVLEEKVLEVPAAEEPKKEKKIKKEKVKKKKQDK